MYSMRVHESTISKFLPIVCKSIIEKLRPIYLKTPNTKEQWKATADKFNELWNFPNCLGALDGRHITFRAPISDGSFYYNYKGSNSIVLLALVNANYMFTYVNIGVNGRISDGGVFSRSNLCNGMKSNLLNFPETVELPGTTEKVPYVIVGDDAFPLLTNLMKPYPERDLTHDCRIFNYRLSRARRIVENAFGILANRFRVLLNPINLNVEKVELITLTCIIIHNFLATENVRYTDINEPLEQLARLSRQGGNRSSPAARNVRDTYKQYFNSPQGIVDWQENSIRMFNH
ncbi:hypothetical protein WA026_021874 [Henosepilachna vigintioctopunctata]|uniref:DDE Tnp4 domain-containing protein n=1 Tax=Henosepilachna vigintioctopunctata TaxID=420089 RepID=A0AAW1URC7_9CUCU